MTIKIGIMGYGNLGRGIECAVKCNPDMELAAVFTRRIRFSVQILTEGARVCRADEIADWQGKTGCGNPLRRKRYRSSGSDAEAGRDVSCSRQL